MKTIEVTDNFRINLDDKNNQLVQFFPSKLIEVGVKKGEMTTEQWKPIECYLPSISACIYEILKREQNLIMSERLDLANYAEQLEDLKKEVFDRFK